jgi:hypothetical protein
MQTREEQREAIRQERLARARAAAKRRRAADRRDAVETVGGGCLVVLGVLLLNAVALAIFIWVVVTVLRALGVAI